MKDHFQFAKRYACCMKCLKKYRVRLTFNGLHWCGIPLEELPSKIRRYKKKKIVS